MAAAPHRHHPPHPLPGPAIAVALAGLSLSLHCLAQGGPPMLTDDPGTPGAGNWEINFAYLGEHGYGERVDSFPHLDFNYGLGDNIQLKYETGWLFMDALDGQGQKSGLDNSLLGVKWRFLDKDRFGADLSIYPQLQLENPDHAVARGIAAPGPNLFLPVEAAVQVGAIRLVVEIGYQYLRKEKDQWVAGLLAAFEPAEGMEVLAELRSLSSRFLTSGDLILNVGLRKDLGSHWKLLASAGTGINNGPDRTQFIGYLGIQWLFVREERREPGADTKH
jgi:hypothetical protein